MLLQMLAKLILYYKAETRCKEHWKQGETYSQIHITIEGRLPNRAKMKLRMNCSVL